jgi:hypothetical protein
MAANNRLFGAIQSLLGFDQQDQNPENLNEQDQARKRRQKMQAQQGTMAPYSGAASTLFNAGGNQF